MCFCYVNHHFVTAVNSFGYSTGLSTQKLPVLSLRAPLRGKADKVIMTMVTLIGNPVQSASPFTSPTLPKECKRLLNPNASKNNPQQHEKPTFSLIAPPRDIPTYVSTTAASTTTVDDDNDDCHLSHPLCVIDDNFEITPAFLLQWEEFYNGYIQLDKSLGASTPSNTEKTTASLPEAPSAVDSEPANDDPGTTKDLPSELDHNELIQLVNPFSASPSRHPTRDAPPDNDTDENNNCANKDQGNNDRDDCSHDTRTNDDRSINARAKTERDTTDPDDSYCNSNGNDEQNTTHRTHEHKTDESDIDSRDNNHHDVDVCDNSYDADRSNSAHATHLSNTIADSRILTTKQKILAQLEQLQVLMDSLLQLFTQPGLTTAITNNTIHSASPWNPDSLQTTTYNATGMMVDDDRTFAPPPPPAPNPADTESTGVLWPQPRPARKTIPFKKKTTTKHTFARYGDQDLRPP